MHQRGSGYEQQIEAGKAIVKEMLARLAVELNRPKIQEFVFKVTDQDVDRKQISIFDPERQRVVTKLEEGELADCPTTPAISSKVKARLAAAIRSYYKPTGR